MLEICLPFNDNFRCLKAAAAGIKRFVPEPSVLLHVQKPDQKSGALKVFSDLSIPAKVITEGEHPSHDMTGIMDDLFAAATADIVIMTEQDVFLVRDLDPLLSLAKDGPFDVIGPLDTMFIDRSQAAGRPMYGDYSRLSPRPGYIHSSLMVLNRPRVKELAGIRPFRVNPAEHLFGRGVLGAEVYYGICQRYYTAGQAKRLVFLRQLHGAYGYSAELRFHDELFAHHLFFSSTREGYVKSGFLDNETCAWLSFEENRFLDWYEHDVLWAKPLPLPPTSEIPGSKRETVIGQVSLILLESAHRCSLDILDGFVSEFVEDVLPHLNPDIFECRHAAQLYALVRSMRPTLMVETGVRAGESTIAILAAMERNGHGSLWSADVEPPWPSLLAFVGGRGITSVRLPPRVTGLLPRMFGPSAARWHFYPGPGTAMLDLLLDYQKNGVAVDVFFHHSDHGYENQKQEYERAWRAVRPGGLIGGDDTTYGPAPFAFFEMVKEKNLVGREFGRGHLALRPSSSGLDRADVVPLPASSKPVEPRDTADAPRYQVFILYWASRAFPYSNIATKKCVDSVFETAPPGTEIVLVDNYSEPGLLEELLPALPPGVRVLKNDRPCRSEVSGLNKVWTSCTAPYMMYLHVDCVVTPRCLSTLFEEVRLLEERTRRPTVLTPFTIPYIMDDLVLRDATKDTPGQSKFDTFEDFVRYRNQHAGHIPISDGRVVSEKPDVNRIGETARNVMIFACSRTFIDRVGPWDERYLGAGLPDVEMGMLAIMKGCNNAHSRTTFVHHLSSFTQFSENRPISVNNVPLFNEKWGPEVSRQFWDGTIWDRLRHLRDSGGTMPSPLS